MKSIYCLILMSLLMYSVVDADWKKNQKYSNVGYTSICDVGNDIIYLHDVDDYHILKSTNKGKSWLRNKILYTPKEISFNSMYFFDENIGWIIGNQSTLLHTANGGGTWTLQSCPVKSAFMTDVEMYDEKNGLASCSNGEIFITENTGQKWEAVNSGIGENITDICIVNNQLTYALSKGNLIKSTNKGKTWTKELIKQGRVLFRIKFLNEQAGYIVGNDGLVLFSDNAGKTWVERNIDSKEFLTNIFFSTPEIAWVTTFDTSIFFTSDAGKTWVKLYEDPTENRPLFDIHFFDDLNGLVVGNKYLMLTKNGGQSSVLDSKNDNNKNLEIYPSVAQTSDQLTFKFKNDSEHIKEVVMVDFLGNQKKIDKDNIIAPRERGVYFIKVISNRSIYSKKILVQ